MSVSAISIPRPALLRAAMILAAVLGALDILSGTAALGGGFFAPPAVGMVMILLGALTVVITIPAWSGRRWAAWTVVGLRLASALSGVPAFFAAGLPVAAVIAAAAGVAAAVAVAVLVSFGLAVRR